MEFRDTCLEAVVEMKGADEIIGRKIIRKDYRQNAQKGIYAEV